MKKKLFKPFLWGILTLSTLSSCRTEDNLNQQQQEKDMRFAVFTPQPGKTVNYADGFAHLMKRYDSIHKTNLSGMNNAPVISHLNASTDKNNLSSQNGETFVAFNIRSQTVTEENGNKWVVFPEVTNGKIANLVIGFLSEKETKVHYYLASKESELYKNNISLFQSSLERYMKRINKLNLNASLNPVSYVKEAQIEEVVITVPKKNLDPRESFGGINPAYNTGRGSCSDYGGCINDYYAPGGGGGGGNSLSHVDDTCAKLKAQQNMEEYKKRIEALENKLKETHENGYIQDKDGNYAELTQRGESENSKSMRLPNDISNLRGFLHTHVKKTSVVIDGEVYEAEGVDMFSPADVERFLEIAKFSAAQGRSLDDIFAVMVSSSGNYTLKFTGDKNQIITKFQDNSLNIGIYLRYMQQTSGEFKNMSMEQKFLKYLDEYMYARGVSLYKDNKDGTNTRMDLNESNKKEMKKSDC